MLSEFSMKQTALPCQPYLDKKCENCTYFSSVQNRETSFARTIEFSGLANSNMLSEFFREQMTLPWQPNLGNKKQNCNN